MVQIRRAFSKTSFFTLACVLTFFFQGIAHTQTADVLLEHLIRIQGVSTQEHRVRAFIETSVRHILQQNKLDKIARVTTDNAGNFIVEFGHGPLEILFIAHMDEIGWKIEAVEENGTLVLKSLGGFYFKLFQGKIIYFIQKNETLHALITEIDQENRTARAWTGYATRSEALQAGFQEGLIGTIKKEYFRLLNSKRMGRSMDDRVGCTAMLLALKKLKPDDIHNRIAFVWAVEEEIGLNGAHVVAQRFKPRVVVAVDTFVSNDSPLESDHFAVSRIGQGPVGRFGDHSNITPSKWIDWVKKLAQKRQIPFQFGVTGGGNDGAAFTPYGASDIPLGWAVRYSHSAVEMIDIRDVEQLGNRVYTIAKEFSANVTKK